MEKIMIKKYRTKQKITYQKERAVLSDTLPYEIPAIFSNRFFYRFLINNKISIKEKNGQIAFDNMEEGIEDIIELLFNVQQKDEFSFKKRERNIPFNFKIIHKKNDYRTLSLMHPFNQLRVVDFYDSYKEIIKYFSNQSEFSIRKPYKVAKNRYANDYLESTKNTDKELQGKIEIYKNNNEHLKSFFAYEKYDNIHKFFESYEYQRCEKKFDKLYKFDINKCFDSIYTHTIAWALINKEIVKDNLNSNLDKTFAGKFDKLMQNMNYGETNGILIGAEVSRIFTELILQKIDRNIQNKLALEEKPLKYKIHYEIFRYVDDYFLFYDSEESKELIMSTFKHELKKYNFYISDVKSIEFTKPIITDLTIAKTKITELINSMFAYKVIATEENKKQKEWVISLKSKEAITKFKIIIKESDVEYRDVLNYSLATIEKRLLILMEKFTKEQDKKPYSNMVLSFCTQILDFSFFIYSVSPRVTSTIKIVSLISKLLEFIKNDKKTNKIFKNYEVELVYKKIYDEIYHILKKNKFKKYTQNETLYLLITLKELGKNYRLDSAFIKEYFFREEFEINYFVIVTLLYYIENIKRYEIIKQKIILEIQNKFTTFNQDNLRKSTELTLLLLDAMTCPYISEDSKNDFLKLNNIDDTNQQKRIIQFSQNQKYWFIKWKDFNLAKEIEMKRSQEVYS